ncbi:hypothetical protein [Prauserella endophytica]|uniref:WG repeat-containing protein n=1 Tax=Prauserella endophytica TaxID=1592324 RepID=A0ABY2RU50_9PSEU|nr:hypothetical protein [Prauserella endophytica]TKG58888.1 hypothetical protein FCN18_37365 [Prauserella endophytica]
MIGYGDALCHIEDDGTVVVDRADTYIGIATDLLAHGAAALHFDDGHLVLDTAGHYRYRPILFDAEGRIVVCERIQPRD